MFDRTNVSFVAKLRVVEVENDGEENITLFRRGREHG
jgi:hypothetical protein